MHRRRCLRGNRERQSIPCSCEVEASNGVIGWGQIYAGGWQSAVVALDHSVAPLVLGQDVFERILQSGGKDVFVHISALERAGLSTLNEGATVDYEIVSDRGKELAGNLKVRK